MTMNQSETPYHPWSTYAAAREEARQRGDRRIGTEHLVLGLLRDEDIEELLGTTLGAAREEFSRLDRGALGAIGVAPVPEVPLLAERSLPPRPTIRSVLEQRIKMTPAAKGALQQAGNPMRRGEHITPGRVLAALLENRPPDPGVGLLIALGVDLAEVRRRLREADAN
jgi:hypothetical protein